MTEMIERVARAIDPVAWELRDQLGNPLEQRQYLARRRARAAIEAMRPATEWMVELGSGALPGDAYHTDLRDVWDLMAYAALNDPSPDDPDD